MAITILSRKRRGWAGYGILTMNYGTCIYLHSHISEDVLTTTAAPSVTTVTTVPDDTDIPNAVVVEINGFTPSTVTITTITP